MDYKSPTYHCAVLCFCEDAIHIDVTISGFESKEDAEAFVKPSWILLAAEEALFLNLGKNDDAIYFELDKRHVLLRQDLKAAKRTPLDPGDPISKALIMEALKDFEAGVDNPLNMREEDLEPVGEWSFARLYQVLGGKKNTSLKIDQYLAFGIQQSDNRFERDTALIKTWRSRKGSL
jgi:hypothetical protein